MRRLILGATLVGLFASVAACGDDEPGPGPGATNHPALSDSAGVEAYYNSQRAAAYELTCELFFSCSDGNGYASVEDCVLDSGVEPYAHAFANQGPIDDVSEACREAALIVADRELSYAEEGLATCTSFTCGDGAVIGSWLLCDGYPSCQDGSDEDDCEGKLFVCDGDYTLPLSDVCDGAEQCDDGTDEDDCEGKLFECDNGNRVSLDDVCDGGNHCGDDSDEQGCPATSLGYVYELCPTYID